MWMSKSEDLPIVVQERPRVIGSYTSFVVTAFLRVFAERSFYLHLINKKQEKEK